MDNFLGEIRAFGFNQIPNGWLPCEGQSLPIRTNQGLFALLGVRYGGDGRDTFNVPDLRGEAMLHFGTAKSGTIYPLGNPTINGTETVPLSEASAPPHGHEFRVANTTGSVLLNDRNKNIALFSKLPNFGTITTDTVNYFIPPTAVSNITPLVASSIENSGGSQGHENRMPFLPVQLCIATIGIYPPRQ